MPGSTSTSLGVVLYETMWAQRLFDGGIVFGGADAGASRRRDSPPAVRTPAFPKIWPRFARSAWISRPSDDIKRRRDLAADLRRWLNNRADPPRPISRTERAGTLGEPASLHRGQFVRGSRGDRTCRFPALSAGTAFAGPRVGSIGCSRLNRQSWPRQFTRFGVRCRFRSWNRVMRT